MDPRLSAQASRSRLLCEGARGDLAAASSVCARILGFAKTSADSLVTIRHPRAKAARGARARTIGIF